MGDKKNAGLMCNAGHLFRTEKEQRVKRGDRWYCDVLCYQSYRLKNHERRVASMRNKVMEQEVTDRTDYNEGTFESEVKRVGSNLRFNMDLTAPLFKV
jgi:hypothetical protein